MNGIHSQLVKMITEKTWQRDDPVDEGVCKKKPTHIPIGQGCIHAALL